MKTLIAAVAVGVAALFGAVAHADTGGYGSAGYTFYDGDNAELGGITGRLGYRFHPNFAVEGEATVGVQDDDVQVGGVNVNVELDYAAGIYGVGFIPVTEQFDLFGRIGYQTIEGEASGAGAAGSDGDDGFAYGVGAQYFFTERFGVRGEYTRLEGDDSEFDTFGISGVVKF